MKLIGLVFQCPLDVRTKISYELNAAGYKKDYRCNSAMLSHSKETMYNIEMYIDELSALAIKLKYSEYFLRSFGNSTL